MKWIYVNDIGLHISFGQWATPRRSIHATTIKITNIFFEIAYPSRVLHEIWSTASLIDTLWIDAMLNSQFSLRHQIIELWIIWTKNTNKPNENKILSHFLTHWHLPRTQIVIEFITTIEVLIEYYVNRCHNSDSEKFIKFYSTKQWKFNKNVKANAAAAATKLIQALIDILAWEDRVNIDTRSYARYIVVKEHLATS